MCRDDKDLGGIGASQPSAERATRASPQAPTGLGHSASIADADVLNDIAVMMSEFVDKWPNPKKFSTSLALIAKTMRAALTGREHTIAEADETCILRKRARRGLFSASEDSVICGQHIVEQYLRQGYVFDWDATDAARERAQAIEARSGETRQGLDPKDESAVSEADAPNPSRQDISDVLIEALGAMAECAGHTEECAYYGDPDGVCDCGYDAACAKRDDALRQAKAGEA